MHLAVLIAAALVAASPDDQRFAEKWIAARKQILDEYPELIAKARAAVAAVPGRYSVQAKLEQGAARLMATLDRAKAGDVDPPFIDSPPQVGSIGMLRGKRIKIVQRLGPAEARAQINRPLTEREFRAYRREISDLPTVDVIVSGLNLSDVADGQTLDAAGRCFIASRTKTYQSLGGPRTALVIEPFDLANAKAIYRKAVDEELAAVARARDDKTRERARIADHERELKREAAAKREANKYPALLKNARQLENAKLYTAAEKILRRIIAEAPGTPAAAEAQKELDALPPH